MKNNYKLYNIIFPVWLLWISPIILIISLIGNCIIDFLVLRISFHFLKIKDIKTQLKKSFLTVYLFGFLSDIIGMFFMLFIPILIDYFDTRLSFILGRAATWNPFSSVLGLLFVLLCLLISGICIYFFNYRFSFNKTNLDTKQKKIMALTLAIVTAPYLFLFPTSLIY